MTDSSATDPTTKAGDSTAGDEWKNLSSGKRRRAARDRMAVEQGSKCYWCGRQMTAPGSNKGTACTLDHVYHKWDRPDKGKWVAACQGCNYHRGHMRTRQGRAPAEEKPDETR